MTSKILATAACIVVSLTGHVAAQDNLFMLETTLPPEADSWYQAHSEDSAHRSFELPVANVYAQPDTESTILGVLMAAARWEPYLHFSWIFRDGISHGETTWREDVGDWGYGIRQFVVDTVAGWARLPPGPYRPQGWVRLLGPDEHDGLFGSVNSIEGQLMNLEEVEAENVATGVRETVNGTMLIESIEDGVVRFRPEVPSDMPCDPEQEALPDRVVPEYRAKTSSFVTHDLQPKFSMAYPKGC